MTLLRRISLKPYNTFGIEAKAKYFFELTKVEQIEDLVVSDVFQENKVLILGGGSNLLLTQDFDGLVVFNQIKGKHIDFINENDALVTVGAGENWHEFVLYSLANSLGGIENLSLIPGSIGAAPIQNIGAYGVELKDVLESVTFYHLEEKAFVTLSNSACNFGYRDSIFKNELKGKFIISEVVLKLSKNTPLSLSYGAISKQLKQKNIENPTHKNVSDVVIEIRESKLPNPKIIGNSGSFFKNPVISNEQFKALKTTFNNIVGYPQGENNTKVPAGWLIEQAEWKGRIVGNTGTYKNQALVLVNHGNATGEEVWNLAKAIQKSVLDKFGINIYPEVNVI